MKRKSVVRVVFAAAAAAFVLLSPVCIFCDEDGNASHEGKREYVAVKTIEGTVTSIDAVGSVLTLRPFEAQGPNSDQLTFQISPKTKVCKGNDTISSSDIEIGDVVTVRYADDPAGLKADTITVQ